MISKLNCGNCTNTYQSSGEYQPTVLIQCGHGLCRTCANTMGVKIVGDIAEGKKVTCPYCKTLSDKAVVNWDLVAKISGCFTQNALVKKRATEDLYYMLQYARKCMKQTDRVLKFLDNGADPNLTTPNYIGKNPMLCFVLNHDNKLWDWDWAEREKIAKKLIDLGAVVDGINGKGQTALILAAIDGNVNAAQILVEGGANVNARSQEGETAIDLAKKGGHDNIVAFLSNSGI